MAFTSITHASKIHFQQVILLFQTHFTSHLILIFSLIKKTRHTLLYSPNNTIKDNKTQRDRETERERNQKRWKIAYTMNYYKKYSKNFHLLLSLQSLLFQNGGFISTVHQKPLFLFVSTINTFLPSSLSSINTLLSLLSLSSFSHHHHQQHLFFSLLFPLLSFSLSNSWLLLFLSLPSLLSQTLVPS